MFVIGCALVIVASTAESVVYPATACSRPPSGSHMRDTGQSLPTPTEAPTVTDAPDDNGHALDVAWLPSPDEVDGLVVAYEVWRSESLGGLYMRRARLRAVAHSYRDTGGKNPRLADYLPSGTPYHYRIRTVAQAGVADSPASAPAAAVGQWYHRGKTPVLVGSALFVCCVLCFIRGARSGRELYLRPIAGIEAIDEAIGRATEMGRPILYLLGRGGPAHVASIASFGILARVAKRTAEYGARLMVPTQGALMMTVVDETARAAYAEVGHPDTYQEDTVFYLTSGQFPFVAAVSGIMLREEPGANFYMGYFGAESLFLAEVGHAAGSIQISGTNAMAQIPFFVVATDYTLIGEEFFAASAYLGKDRLLASVIKAQDYAKALLIATLLAGVITVSFGWHGIVGLLGATP